MVAQVMDHQETHLLELQILAVVEEDKVKVQSLVQELVDLV